MAQNPNPSNLSEQQIIQRVMDESEDRLRVDAIVTATIADVIIHASESSIAIGDQSSGHLMTVNSDGSINADTIIESTEDNIAIGNQAGTNFLAVNPDGSINTTVTSSSLPAGAATSALQITGNSSLSSIDSKLTSPIAVNQSGTWSVTANAGTNLNTSALALNTTVSNVQGSVTGGTAATKSELIGGIYNTSIPTLTNGQQSSIQFDVNGNLNTSVGNIANIVSQKTMANSIPVTIASDQTTTPYAIQLDNTSTANVTYIGKAAVNSLTSSAVWQIQKMDQTSGLVITWAGSAAFTQIWNNRTSLTYT